MVEEAKEGRDPAGPIGIAYAWYRSAAVRCLSEEAWTATGDLPAPLRQALTT
jgi:hypothetical protein